MDGVTLSFLAITAAVFAIHLLVQVSNNDGRLHWTHAPNAALNTVATGLRVIAIALFVVAVVLTFGGALSALANRR